jgi:aminopeptidase YwaD
MMKHRVVLMSALILLILSVPYSSIGQTPRLPKTPLSQKTIDLLVNEISGQVIYNNEVILAGAPWIREKAEFSDTFYESQKIYDMAKSYGIETARLDRFPSDEKINYAFEGEFWIVKPKKELVARLDADAALVASRSSTVDITSELVYIPPIQAKDLKEWKAKGLQEKYKGKIALMWSHARRDFAEALDAAGIVGVISFRAQDRYFDPDQIVYSGGSYSGKENLKFGMTISWRQWSEIMEDLQKGKKFTVRCKTSVEEFQDKFETVVAWIPGTEPDKKGVIFTAHLFEGYTKRGANDNMSGCVVQLEILRALTKLIASGELPQPRRTIYFLWPNEISGTFKHFEQNPSFAEKLSCNINMDMVGEGLRKNNAQFTWTECPNHLPSYVDGLGNSIMNHVWRTNDIVFLPDSMRNPRGQIFPKPMWEKNGSRDAFRYDIKLATGGSDHICFNNPLVAVPGVELNVWPDQWYHADTDTPDKSDPTQMKRVAFIGAACAWVAANCTDDVLDPLLDAVSGFGYLRIGERELPKALAFVDNAKAKTLEKDVGKALNLASFAVGREIGALQSLKEICSGSESAVQIIDNRIKQWKYYGKGLEEQILKYGTLRASQLDVAAPRKPEITDDEIQYSNVFPDFHSDVKGVKFSLERTDRYSEYVKENADAVKKLKLNRYLQRSIQNFINGERSVTEIRNAVTAEIGADLSFERLFGYLEMLKEMNWVEF